MTIDMGCMYTKDKVLGGRGKLNWRRGVKNTKTVARKAWESQ